MKIFNHVQIKVEDLEKSKKFYDRIMEVLGYKIVLEIKNIVIGYGTSTNDMFEIRQKDNNAQITKSVHIAFNAKNKEAVNNFYNLAIKLGAACNGKPGLRPEYESSYFAAFIKDLDGNNIEAVYNLQ